jgi:hypothetical protein
MIREFRLSARTALILGLATVGTAGCRDADFLYHEAVPTPATVQFTRAVREMQGSDLVDILWVIDNSGSMSTYQQEVIANTDLFMQEFTRKSQVRWRMGLISTDESENPYLGFRSPFEWTAANPVNLFRAAVGRLGTGGSGTEKSFVPVLTHLRRNPTFLRPGASLALVFVTDAEEQSSQSEGDFLTQLAQVRGRADQLLAYGVFGADDLGCGAGNGEGRWDYAGSPYEGVIASVNGRVYPICQPFGPSLSDLARDLVQRVNTPVLYLGRRPDPSTLVVRHKGVVIPGGPKELGGYWRYDYDRVAIVFHDLSFAIGNTEEVEVTFEEAPGALPRGRS